jgi:2',3'-cyclic-nucleotide 2'-phosphodiesterase (5'-nucleotidase family)
MIRKFFFVIIVIITLPGSCSFTKPPTHIFSEPEWNESNVTRDKRRIVIASTHNFKGSIFEENVKFPLQGKKINYKLFVGGVSTLKSYLDILKYRYDKDLILLDTGHLFNLDHNIKDLDHMEEHEKILEIYEKMDYDAVNLTDVDYRGLKLIKPKSHKIPFITSNIINLGKNKSISEYGVSPYKIFDKNGVKIGIIGLTSFEKVDSKKTEKFRGIYFEDPILSFLKTKKILIDKGVQIILLMSSVKSYEELKSLVKRLPPNSVDLIISGNTYTDENRINGIPLLQNPGKGQFISRIEFFYDLKDNVILNDETINHDVTKVCHNFFRSTMDCHNHKVKEFSRERVKLISKSSYEIVPAKFLGHEVVKSQIIEELINK